MGRLFFAAIAVAALAGPVAAQPAARTPATTFDAAVGALLGQPGGLTADVAASRATKASPAARRKAAEVGAARADLAQVKLAVVPRASVGASYTRLSELDPPAPPFDTFFPVLNNSYHLGADVSYSLTEVFLRMPALKQASQHGIDAALLAERTAGATAATEARVAYYEWVRARLQAIVAERLLIQVTANLDQVRALAEVQRVSKADVLRLEALRAQAELSVAQVAQAVALRSEQLRALIGAEPEEELTIGEDVREAGTVPELGAADALLRTALDQRLELRALDAASAAVGRQRKAAKVDRLPQLDLFATASYDNPNQRIVPPEDAFNLTWAAGARLTWSLNGFLRASPADAKLAAQERALAADRAGLALGIRTELAGAREGVRLADAALAATSKGLTAAEESYRVRQELLAAQRATAVELVDAESELTRARVAAIDALIDRRIAWARLHHATGADAR